MNKAHLLARVARVGASTVLANNVRPAVPILSRSIVTLTHCAARAPGLSDAARTPHTLITSPPSSVTLSRAFSSSNSSFSAESSKPNQRHDWIDDVCIQHLTLPCFCLYPSKTLMTV